MAAKRKKNNIPDNPNLQTALRILSGSAVGLLLLFGFLFGAAALSLKEDISGTLFILLAFCACALPALICGFIAVRPIRKNGVVFGLLSGLPLCLALIALCAAFYGQLNRNAGFAILLIELCGILGGIAAVNFRSKHRYASYAVR